MAEVLAIKLKVQNYTLKKVKVPLKECWNLVVGPGGIPNLHDRCWVGRQGKHCPQVIHLLFTSREEGFGVCGHKTSKLMETPIPFQSGERHDGETEETHSTNQLLPLFIK